MKKFKLSVLAMALTTMLGFTSCLDNGDSDYGGGGYGAEIVRNSSYWGTHSFVNQYGAVYEPLNASQVTTWPSTEFSYIMYSYEAEEVTDTTDNRINVTLMTLAAVNDGSVLARRPMDTDANAPVNYFATGDGNAVAFYQLNDMILSINFFRRNVDNDEVLEEIDKHQFSLYYNAEEDFTSSSMTFYLRHNVTDLQDDDNFNVTVSNLYHFNMASAFAQYQQMFGKEPTRIVISYEQNSSNGSYEDNMVADRTYEFNYEDMVKNYKTWLEQR